MEAKVTDAEILAAYYRRWGDGDEGPDHQAEIVAAVRRCWRATTRDSRLAAFEDWGDPSDAVRYWMLRRGRAGKTPKRKRRELKGAALQHRWESSREARLRELQRRIDDLRREQDLLIREHSGEGCMALVQGIAPNKCPHFSWAPARGSTCAHQPVPRGPRSGDPVVCKPAWEELRQRGLVEDEGGMP
ncbi:MAG: hypothetical protein WC683_01750 [bacterium]